MATQVGIYENATGDLLRYGIGETAGAGETKRTDTPIPAKRRYQNGETQMHNWNGSAWVLVAQPTGVQFPEKIRIYKSADEHAIFDAGISFLGSNLTPFVSYSGSGQPDDASSQYLIPSNFDSGLKLGFIWTMDGGSADQMRLAGQVRLTKPGGTELFTGSDESYEILDNGYVGTAWRSLETSMHSITSTVEPGDTCNVETIRTPSDTDDTLNKTVFVYATFLEMLVFGVGS